MLVALLMPLPGRAEPAEPEHQGDANSRELDGLIFIPSRLVRDPFPATYFGLSVESGKGNATGPAINVLGLTVGNQSYSIGGMVSAFDFGARVAPWLSLRLNGGGGTFSGLDGRSVAVAGTSVLLSGGGGITLGTKLGSHVQLAVLGDVTYGPQYDADPFSSIATAIQQGTYKPGSILTHTSRLTFFAGAAAAFAFGPAFGGEVTLSYVHPRLEADDVVENLNEMSGGAVLELDLHQVTPVPLGLVAAYTYYGMFASGDDSHAQEVSGGIYYTGTTRVVVGLDVSGRFFNLRQRLDTSLLIGSIVLRYYWN